MLNVRGLAVLFLLALTGCSVPVAESCEEMSGRYPLNEANRPEHWGATKTYRGPWMENQERPVVFKPPYKMIIGGHPLYCVPQVQSVLLIAKVTNPPVGNCAFRWVLSIGGGGANSRVVIDLLNTQQLSVAGENINVSVMAEKADPTQPFDAPSSVVDLAVSMADGNASGQSATYTQALSVPAGTNVHLPVPSMATGFRLTGNDGAATSPFIATLAIQTDEPGIATTYIASKLSQYTGAFVPLSGSARDLNFINTGLLNPICGVQWDLDL